MTDLFDKPPPTVEEMVQKARDAKARLLGDRVKSASRITSGRLANFDLVTRAVERSPLMRDLIVPDKALAFIYTGDDDDGDEW